MSEFGMFAKEVAITLEISTSNLRKWSMALEENGYHFERNDKNQRIYYDRDFNTLFQIKNLMQKHRNVDDAVKAVVASFNDRQNAEKTLGAILNEPDKLTFSKDELKGLINVAIQAALSEQRNEMKKEIREEVQKEIEPMISGYKEIAATLEKQAALPPPEDEWITKRRVEQKLREEARELWKEKPEEERVTRTGWFRKEEDKVKRDDFIQDYIDKKIIYKDFSY